MSAFTDFPICNLADVVRFESEKTLDERYDARSVYDIFLKSAAQHPDRTALTMLMTGANDETPRLVSYRQLLEGVTRAANFFTALGGPAPGVAYLLPSLIETQFTLWGRKPPAMRCRSIFCCRPTISPNSSGRRTPKSWWRWVRIRNSTSGRRHYWSRRSFPT
jgi:hypothetical protein